MISGSLISMYAGSFTALMCFICSAFTLRIKFSALPMQASYNCWQLQCVSSLREEAKQVCLSSLSFASEVTVQSGSYADWKHPSQEGEKHTGPHPSNATATGPEA